MIETLRNAWRIEEIRKKIVFTLLIVLLYRVGNAIPVPYVNIELLQSYFDQLRSTVLGLLDVMSGGAFSSATIFALSIQPYINASIIIQLLCIAIPALERLSKDEGEEGKKKIAAITRYSTVAIGLLQGFGFYMLIKNNGLLVSEAQGSFWAAVVIILTFTSGSALIMWLGEQITEHGIGNGISMILFASIISRLPSAVIQSVRNIAAGNLKWWAALLVFLGAIAIVVLIVFVNDAERRIPVQYSKRVVGRKMYGGQSTHLPMKVNMSGVMPIIFAQSIASIPATIAAFSGKTDGWFMTHFGTTSILYAIVYFLLIIFFAYFYTSGPFPLAYNGLGDVAVVLFFGLVAVGFTAYVQILAWPASLTVAGIATGLAVNVLLVLNNYRDVENDAKSGKRTLVVLLGKRFGLYLYLGSGLAAAILSVVTYCMLGVSPCWCLLALPYVVLHSLTWKKIRGIQQPIQLNALIGETSRNMLLFAVMVSAVLLVGC